MLERRDGGYIYSPPFRYTLSGGLFFSSKITLIFAPGAVLVPTVGENAPNGVGELPADIIVDGEIEAGTQQIIEPNYVPYSAALRGRSGLRGNLEATHQGASATFGLEILGMGRLMLRSNQIKQVYPEWWGAETWFSENDVSLRSRFDLTDETGLDFATPFARVDATAALQACFDAAQRS